MAGQAFGQLPETPLGETESAGKQDKKSLGPPALVQGLQSPGGQNQIQNHRVQVELEDLVDCHVRDQDHLESAHQDSQQAAPGREKEERRREQRQDGVKHDRIRDQGGADIGQFQRMPPGKEKETGANYKRKAEIQPQKGRQASKA